MCVYTPGPWHRGLSTWSSVNSSKTRSRRIFPLQNAARQFIRSKGYQVQGTGKQKREAVIKILEKVAVEGEFVIYYEAVEPKGLDATRSILAATHPREFAKFLEDCPSALKLSLAEQRKTDEGAHQTKVDNLNRYGVSEETTLPTAIKVGIVLLYAKSSCLHPWSRPLELVISRPRGVTAVYHKNSSIAQVANGWNTVVSFGDSHVRFEFAAEFCSTSRPVFVKISRGHTTSSKSHWPRRQTSFVPRGFFRDFVSDDLRSLQKAYSLTPGKNASTPRRSGLRNATSFPSFQTCFSPKSCAPSKRFVAKQL